MRMTPREINYYLGTKVMGWKVVGDVWFTNSDTVTLQNGFSWEPYRNIKQAFQCLFEFRKYKVEIFMDEFEIECCIGEEVLDGGMSGYEYRGRAVSTTEVLEAVICLACVRASGGET